MKSPITLINAVDKAAFVKAVAPIWESQKDVYGKELLTLLNGYRQ
ncbi:MAG: hypothetical protein ABJJ53_17115 [Sulfitobacter sp.]